MEVVTREIDIKSRSDTVKLTFLGDVHYGGRDCELKLLKRCIDKIGNDVDHYWIGMGDWAEFINYTDKRFDPSDLDPECIELKDLADLPKVQSNGVANLLLPIKARCLGLLEGNHERTIESKYHLRIHGNLCDQLQHNKWNLDLGYSAIIKLRITRAGKTKPIKIYVHHGAGGGRKLGGKVNRIEDMSVSFPYCDIYCMGHVHDRIAFVRAALDACEKKDELYSVNRAFGITGTFKKTYQEGTHGYGERAMYPSTSLGCISFELRLNSITERYDITAHCSTSGLPA